MEVFIIVLVWLPFELILNIAGGVLQSVLVSLTGISLGDLSNQGTAVAALSQSPFITIPLMVIAAPIIEELAYRGIFKQVFKSRVLFYFVSSLLFGLAHTIVGFSFPAALLVMLPTFFSGLAFAIVYGKSNNIWCSILVHALGNGVGVVLTLVAP